MKPKVKLEFDAKGRGEMDKKKVEEPMKPGYKIPAKNEEREKEGEEG